MSRKLSDWIEGYGQYTAGTESAGVFHKWTALSIIAGALGKKVWFNFGRIRVHPNLFVVFVAEPGIARKTQAITFGEEIVSEIPSIIRSADAITPQAMLEDLELARQEEQLPDGTTFEHNSLYIISGEFESFLGQKGDNQKMVVLLTDLFDCKNRPYRYRTKASGSNVISSVFLNLLAATTPDSLASALPARAIGGGLTSRIMFIWAEDKEQKVAIPHVRKDLIVIKNKLVSDLDVISRIAGGYNFTEESQQWWEDWYDRYDERDPLRLCKDTAFKGWYSRKPLLITKVAMLLAAAKRNTMTVTSEEFIRAEDLVKEVERTMSNAFVAVGRSDVAADVAVVSKIVEQEKLIAEEPLLQRVWRDIDANKFDNVSATLIKTGRVKRLYTHPENPKKKGIWYKWLG